ncbi:MAG TPA: tetratricopeptide repeat protein, partial [Thermomicrobiales bacterium]|nr:tetratricopeptide repeat protein [Thermomicrobiales bacterium]
MPDKTDGPESALAGEAVQLFLERARLVRPEFVLTPESAGGVVELCRRLDGLPLAIELAAARVRHLAPASILARMDRQLSLLTGGPRDVPARQQTMEATIAWSYDLLSSGQQRLFNQMAVFPGGWTLDAAEAVADVDFDLLDGLSELVDHSLVLATDDGGGVTRYRMLEPIREFAWELLHRSGEADVLRYRHASYFLTLARKVEHQLGGPDEDRWASLIQAEIDNLRTAFRWGIEHDVGLALEAVAALEWFWLPSGLMTEGRRWLTEAHQASQGVPGHIVAKSLNVLGTLMGWQGDLDNARTSIERALALYEQQGDRQGIAKAQLNLARTYRFLGDSTSARQLNEQSLANYRVLGERRWMAAALGNLANSFADLGDLDRAIEMMEEALSIELEIGATSGARVSLSNLGTLELDRGNADQAIQRFTESLTLNHRTGKPRELRDSRFDIEDLEGIAAVILESDPLRAAQLLGAASALRERTDYPMNYHAIRERHKRLTERLSALLDTATLASAWAHGMMMTTDDAIHVALTERHQAPQSITPAEHMKLQALSRRELDVLRGIVDGKTNQEIAADLFISPNTVTNHVTSILNKLGLDSRT